MTTYDEYRAMMKASTKSAYEYIPNMCNALREEDPTLNDEEIRSRVTKDCLEEGLTKSTIDHYIPAEFKDPKKVKAGKKSAEAKKELIAVTNDGEQDKISVESNSTGSDDSDQKGQDSGILKSQKENITPSFSSAADLSNKPEETDDFKFKKEQYPPLHNINEDLKAEIERLKEINDKYSTELVELRQAVTETSFKPATEVKSFTFNDLPNADNFETFIWKKIKLDKFRMELGPIKAAGDTYFNVYLERTK